VSFGDRFSAAFAAYVQPGARETANTLLWDDFKPSNRQTLDQLSPVAFLDVPAGKLLSLIPGMFGLILKARFQIQFAASASPTKITNLPTNARPIRSAVPFKGTLPSAGHPDVIVWISDDGVTFTKTRVVAFDLDARTVEYEKLPTTTRAEIYFVPGDGAIQLTATRATGSDRVAPKLYGNSQRGLYETNQANERTAPRFQDWKPLAPYWRLLIEVKSVSEIAWNARAEHQIILPTSQLSVNVANRQMLDQSVERYLRGGMQ
jgi:hypothetical protein